MGRLCISVSIFMLGDKEACSLYLNSQTLSSFLCTAVQILENYYANGNTHNVRKEHKTTLGLCGSCL